MAVDTVKASRYQLLAAAIETTTGTLETLDAGDAGFVVRDLSFTPNVNFNKRPQQGGIGSYKGVAGARGGNAKFTFDLYSTGSGIPQWASVWFPSCGLLAAGSVYAPNPSPSVTATMANYRAGRRRIMGGCAGTFDMTATHDTPVALDFAYQGVWHPPTDVTILAPTFDTESPMVGTNTLTFGTDTLTIGTLKFSLGGNVIMRPDINAKDVANRHLGFRSAWVTGIEPTITIDPEALPLTTKDWYELFAAGTEFAWNCVIGSTAGSIITFAATKCQVTAPPGDGDRNGLDVDNVTMAINESTLSITFS